MNITCVECGQVISSDDFKVKPVPITEDSFERDRCMDCHDIIESALKWKRKALVK